jgi:hypothetical protein
MNVEQLRRVLADLPADTPIVLEDSNTGWMEHVALYLAPAHIHRRISGNYLYVRHQEGADNCHALLISGFHQSDEGVVEISPRSAWPKVIDAEADVSRPRGFGDQDVINPATESNGVQGGVSQSEDFGGDEGQHRG